jgi:hypothetical protein
LGFKRKYLKGGASINIETVFGVGFIFNVKEEQARY